MSLEKDRYRSGEYLCHNPTWDEEDSPWKAEKIIRLLQRHRLAPGSICEVGCGAGGILAELRDRLGPSCSLVGFDIAPALESFWAKHESKGIRFVLGDFLTADAGSTYDLLLLADVLEHLENPLDFLRRVVSRAGHFVLHIPLDLHAQGALRNSPLLRARRRTGHLHYWNKDLVLDMLQECGLEILHWEYTAGTLELPKASWQRRLARGPRRLLFALAPDLAVRALGGYSLLVLACRGESTPATTGV